jgi:tRNA(Ile)-lysidine synthase
LKSLNQPWREDSTNQNLAHTRNRVRHTLLPLMEREFNPAIRETLADTADLARAEEDYWSDQLSQLLPRLIMEGKPSRSGRSTSGGSQSVLALDITMLRNLSLALQRRVLQGVAERFGVTLEFKHIQQLTSIIEGDKQVKNLALPAELEINRTLRELQFRQKVDHSRENYSYSLPIPGEIAVPELQCTIRATPINAGKQKVSGYNTASLLNPSLLEPKLTIRNWRAGDRFFPAHSQSPKKVKELLQPDRLGRLFSLAERKIWPVIECKGQIVWMRGFPVPAAFAGSTENAILIEERKMNGEVPE